MSNLIFFDLNLAESGQPSVPSRDEAERRFREAAAQVGVNASGLGFEATDDRILRCDTIDERRGKGSGWYVIHQDGDLFSGFVGNWKTGETVSFWGRDEAQVTQEDRARLEARRVANELARTEVRRVATARARALLNNLQEQCPPDHPYLARKQVKPHGTLRMGDLMVIPMFDANGNVVSYQTIDGTGDKNFATDCSARGMYAIGAATPVVVACEGFATGAAIHEATGLRVYITFNCYNMPAMIEGIAAIEAKNAAQIVIAADNDESGTGKREADKAAAKIGGATVLMPSEVGTDWNDISITRPDELRQAFASIRPLFIGWEEIDFADIPRRDWVYGNTYIRKFVSMTVAPGGLGKSTLVLTEAVAMATGRNLVGVEPKGKCKVIYHNAEDPMVEIQLRVAAICVKYNIDQRELKGQLFIQSGRDAEILLAQGDQGDIIEPAFQRMEAFIKFHSIDVIVLDPLANMHDAEEDNRTYRKLGKRLSLLTDACNCAGHLVHHTRKLNGLSATVEDSRGGSALIGAVRVARALNPMDAEEAAKFGLDTHIDHFRVEPAGKNNLARPAHKAEWYLREGIPMPNGDYCAIVSQWTPPDPFEGIDDAHAKRVQVILQDNKTDQWRESAQSKEWIGNLVAQVTGLDVEDKAVRAKIKSVVRSWISSGILAVDHVSAKGKAREIPIVTVGPNLM